MPSCNLLSHHWAVYLFPLVVRCFHSLSRAALRSFSIRCTAFSCSAQSVILCASGPASFQLFYLSVHLHFSKSACESHQKVPLDSWNPVVVSAAPHRSPNLHDKSNVILLSEYTFHENPPNEIKCKAAGQSSGWLHLKPSWRCNYIKTNRFCESVHLKKKKPWCGNCRQQGFVGVHIPAESQQGAVRQDDPAPDRRLVQNEEKKKTLYRESVQGSEASHYLQLASSPLAAKRDLSEKKADVQNHEMTQDSSVWRCTWIKTTWKNKTSKLIPLGFKILLTNQM